MDCSWPYPWAHARRPRRRAHDVFKLALEAQKRWDRLQGYNLPPLVAQGVRFVDGEIDQAA